MSSDDSSPPEGYVTPTRSIRDEMIDLRYRIAAHEYQARLTVDIHTEREERFLELQRSHTRLIQDIESALGTGKDCGCRCDTCESEMKRIFVVLSNNSSLRGDL